MSDDPLPEAVRFPCSICGGLRLVRFATVEELERRSIHPADDTLYVVPSACPACDCVSSEAES